MLPRLQTQHLTAKQVLGMPDEPIQRVYFPRGAVISLLVPMESGASVEAATVGWEGMFGLPVYLGDGLAQDETVCQISGEAASMSVTAFRQAVADCPELQTLLQRYALALMGQMARTAGCNRAHPVEERCARWLLMTHDRVGQDEFFLTHEFLAAMLGVRRASVTLVAGQFQQAGLIRYRRGNLTIVDREGLEEASCEDYRLTHHIYERLYRTATPPPQLARAWTGRG
ncbi:MAG: Crp/Fnr family transcriptional regulator [Chloroflexi bacterium]|nr:Crp/Fnr family transcriptional regulator [Chloroflexota bacterium]